LTLTMLELRDLYCLNTLARLRHFARAAAECGVSQPAFSMRIRRLEDRLGVAIVRRGNRYLGLTSEGEVIVRHARRILDDVRFLEQDLLAAEGRIAGPLSLGVVPTAAAYAAGVAVRLRAAHPGIVARIETASSLTIERRIEDGTIDAGITYADSVPSETVSARHLYDERYVLLAPTLLMGGRTDAISWREAAEFPLSLLEPGMQNRRIIDRTFDEIGVRSQVISETNALTISIAMAREGACATIVPQALVEALGPLSDMSVLPLVEPELRKEICLVCAIREPRLPAIEAFRQVALEDN